MDPANSAFIISDTPTDSPYSSPPSHLTSEDQFSDFDPLIDLVEDQAKNKIMNKLLNDFFNSINPATVHKMELEVIQEVPEEDELESELKTTSANFSLFHQKRVSESRSGQKKDVQKAFAEELQRRCESLVVFSDKLICGEDEGNEKYTELVESRNIWKQGYSESTSDTLKIDGEMCDVLETLKACQQKQETDGEVNYIVDVMAVEHEVVKQEVKSVKNEELIMQPMKEEKKGRRHRRTDSANVDWSKLKRLINETDSQQAMQLFCFWNTNNKIRFLMDSNLKSNVNQQSRI
eukprot:TRINITY_DN120778_c0_g1_i1.p1 TRINITY_DN120778_c0_g1~~TRINITY_DN120778_c0_g1_i1.p1  ORF type:complete len:292 (-),score=24.54 TRINITY_DN120778_c0_g1_i1:34-909(-)